MAQATAAIQYGKVKARKWGKKGIWSARWTTPDGRRPEQSLEVTNREVAEKKVREISDLLERGDVETLATRHNSRKITFEAFYHEFRSQLYPVGPGDMEGQRRAREDTRR